MYEYREEDYREAIKATSMDDAIDVGMELLRGGDWEPGLVTAYIVAIDDDGNITDERAITVTIDPDPPRCTDGGDHEWQAPHEILGGIKENPGVWGHGGGVIITDICIACGVYRKIDTWAIDPGTGTIYHKIEYQDPDEKSLKWISAVSDDAICRDCGADISVGYSLDGRCVLCAEPHAREQMPDLFA